MADDLDERMRAAGMIPLADLLAGKQPLEPFLAHTAVCDHDSFEWWLNSKNEEYARMRLAYELGDRPKDEMYEWTFAHSAALNEVAANWRAMKHRSSQKAEG